MKKLIMILLAAFIVGCSSVKIETDNKIVEEKQDYLAIKDELNSADKYISDENLPCDIKISLDRINKEEISYRAIIDNPKTNMYNIKALLIHDYFTEDIFPSIGIFDEPQNLIIGNEEVKGFELVGYIETSKDIDVNLKLYLEYTDINGNISDIYYKYNPSEDVNI